MAERDEQEEVLPAPAIEEIEAAIGFALGGRDGVRRLSLAREALRRSEHLALARTISRWIARNRARALAAQSKLEFNPEQIGSPDDA